MTQFCIIRTYSSGNKSWLLRLAWLMLDIAYLYGWDLHIYFCHKLWDWYTYYLCGMFYKKLVSGDINVLFFLPETFFHDSWPNALSVKKERGWCLKYYSIYAIKRLPWRRKYISKYNINDVYHIADVTNVQWISLVWYWLIPISQWIHFHNGYQCA